MSAPKEWRSPTGEVFVLAEVPRALRSAAITIAFANGGPWWEQLIVARVVIANYLRSLKPVDSTENGCPEVDSGGARCMKLAGHRGNHVAEDASDDALQELGVQ